MRNDETSRMSSSWWWSRISRHGCCTAAIENASVRQTPKRRSIVTDDSLSSLGNGKIGEKSGGEKYEVVIIPRPLVIFALFPEIGTVNDTCKDKLNKSKTTFTTYVTNEQSFQREMIHFMRAIPITLLLIR